MESGKEGQAHGDKILFKGGPGLRTGRGARGSSLSITNIKYPKNTERLRTVLSHNIKYKT